MAGRKPFEPTAEDRRLVKAMASYGVPHEAIAVHVINPSTGKPIDEKSLRKHLRAELDAGNAASKALVAQTVFRHATGKGPGAASAAIFLAKVRLGWKEPPQGVELTGKDGGPVEQRTTVVDEKQVAAAVAKLEDDY
ncbi:hypothetical protein BKK79_35840 [Cupriavidus sp. USMAA2-4]|uniref:hypothetical protein n=1 Tax=Cupriavidus sp. USMAA2-4 TaxID=876364 RepID=UPI0008A6F58A|nr:hypothetical protein [Cupriavidus sp. USMAA2-4]AOY96868.1 hypothetical protein BKK79_35840 [Cupriavidus sp. USMAA2-4]